MGLAERVALVATVTLVLAGVGFRARGFLFGAHALWADEAAWALHLIRHVGDDDIRPVGFMAISRLFAAVASPSERTLRLLPWLAGMTTTLLSPFLARRLFDGRAARLMFVAIVALHPAAIDLTKEFKPYSMSLALHALLLYTTLRYASSLRGRDLAGALGIAAVSQFFAQDLVFAYPGAFLVLGWEALRRRGAHLPWVIGSAVAIVLGLAAQYYFIWRHIPSSESTYWGDKYNVFHVRTSPQSYVAWFFERYRGLCDFPGHRRRFWQSDTFSSDTLERLRNIDVSLWVVAHALGLTVLVMRRKYRVLFLALMPVVVLWAFNLLGFWPLGAFRTNLFALLYFSIVAAAAFDGLPALRARAVSIVPAVLLVISPLVLFEDDWHARKRVFAYDGYFPEVVRDLTREVRSEPGNGMETVLFGYGMCGQYDYYTLVHPRAARYRKSLDSLFVSSCTRGAEIERAAKRALQSQKRVWVVVDSKSGDHLDDVAPGAVVTTHRVGNVWVAKLESRRAS